jgi:alpha-tubulin suppressor-like RCC1 family protein
MTRPPLWRSSPRHSGFRLPWLLVSAALGAGGCASLLGIDDVELEGSEGGAGQGGAMAGGAGGNGPGPGGTGGAFAGGAGGPGGRAGGPTGVCRAGETRCVSDQLERCSEGRWSTPEPCAIACGATGGPDGGASCALPVQVVAGSRHACARLSDGGVRCWGDNLAGQLGNGSNAGSPKPVAVPGVAGAKQLVSNGRSTTCAVVADDTALCWGDNNGGLISNAPGSVRTPTPLSPFKLKQVALGALHACALAADGRVFCRGSDVLGQLGDGNEGGGEGNPFVVTNALSGAPTALAAGFVHTCALLAEGFVDCWGDGRQRQHGNPDAGVDPLLEPGRVADLDGAQRLAAGGNVSCALRADRRLSCWGENNFGQLGRGSASPDGSNAGLVSDLNEAAAVAVGATHACAVRADKSLWCWGENTSGQLGNDCGSVACSTVDEALFRPLPSKALLENVADVSAGTEFTCALVEGPDVLCWGRNDQGQLGRGQAGISEPIPAPVAWR